jgi:hypothetical protein
MTKIILRGKEYEHAAINGIYGRLAVQYRNNIITSLRKLGVKEDNVKIEIPRMPFKKELASASWYLEGRHLYYSCNRSTSYAGNLHLVLKVIEHHVTEVLSDTMTLNDFYEEFEEDPEVETSRKDARAELGLPEDADDFELITKTYKRMAKDHHPDMANGDEARFKAINKAHKILKRELT